MKKTGNDKAAHFVAIIGTTWCGKSTELKRRLAQKRRPRVMVWSPKEPLDRYVDFFPGAQLLRSMSEVLDAVGKAGKRGKFALVFQPTLSRAKDEAAFSLFCKIALAAGSLTLVVEELHSVTKPSSAPDGWSKLCFMGRGYGVEVFGLSQRPASVDKAFMGSLSACHCGRLSYPEDQKTMAKAMGISIGDIAGLTGYQAMQKDFSTGKTSRLP